MKIPQNFPEIRRNSCKTCSKLHQQSGSCVDLNIDNIYAPQQASTESCELFVETRQEFFPAITLENVNDY